MRIELFDGHLLKAWVTESPEVSPATHWQAGESTADGHHVQRALGDGMGFLDGRWT